MNKFYVYVLRRPNGTPFYVGKGSAYRLNSHVWAAKRGWRGHRFNVIRKILSEGGEIKAEKIWTNLSHADAVYFERQLIRDYRGMYPGLTNATDWGEGALGYKHTPESIANLKDKWKERHKPLSEEARKKISERSKGRKHSMEARAKLSAAASGKNHWNYGRTITKDHHDRMMAAHKRAVRVSGVVFDSLVAAAKAHGVSPETVLYRCARGVRFPDWEYV